MTSSSTLDLSASPTVSSFPSAAVRRAAYAALGIALVHIVFGAIVRISGSGMGCGDHWPKCYGLCVPPFERVDLVIEVMHRYLAAVIGVAVTLLTVLAWRSASRGGAARAAFRSSLAALAIVIITGAFGAVTVKFANAPWATVVHLSLAVSLLATLVVTVARAGGFGVPSLTAAAPDGTTRAAGTRKAVGAATGAVALALLVLLMGGLTAKIPGAAVACAGFPLCGDGSLGGGAQHTQLTHRLLAYLLVLHLVSLPFLFRKRGEPAVVVRAATAAAVFGVLQVVWAGWMVLGGFPNVVRSMHQATGILIWVSSVTMLYLARVASRRTVLESPASIGSVRPDGRRAVSPQPAR